MEENKNILTFCRTNDAITSDKCIQINKNSVKINDKEYLVDKVMHKQTQKEVFATLSDFIMTGAEEGINATVFAYGSTGSGKTFTIQGDKNDTGLIHRTLQWIHNKYSKITLSFLEIYNEEINDLGRPRDDGWDFNESFTCTSQAGGRYSPNDLNIREVFSNSELELRSTVVVDDLYTFPSKTYSESLDFYTNGISHRKTAATTQNDKSSRSHSVFTICIETETEEYMTRESKITFVDLAGSEKVNSSDRIEKHKTSTTATEINLSQKLFKETTNINQSLMNLGIIVNCLGRKDTKHIPYRDSKLTFLLKDSLGGSSKLCIIGNINPSNVLDSVSTLQFLQRVKLIKSNPAVNYKSNLKIREVLNYLELENSKMKKEIKELKAHQQTNQKLQNDIKEARIEMDGAMLNLSDLRICVKGLRDLHYNRNDNFDLINEHMHRIREILEEEAKNSLKNILNGEESNEEENNINSTRDNSTMNF